MAEFLVYAPKVYDTKGEGIKDAMRKIYFRKLGKWEENTTADKREPRVDHLGSLTHASDSQSGHGWVSAQALVLEGVIWGNRNTFIYSSVYYGCNKRQLALP